MKLMLAAFLMFLLVGLLPLELGRRQHAAIALIAATMTALYLVLGRRLM